MGGQRTDLRRQALLQPILQVFTMRNGRIKQVNEYFCNILADEVLWPLVAAMGKEIPPS